MKVLGILGSPRINSNCGMLLDEFLSGAASEGAEVKKISLGKMDFKGCISCGGCDKTGVCILKDDMTSVYSQIKQADVIVLASPVYFAGITSQLKAMIDRFQSEWVARFMLKKRKAQSAKRKTDKKGVFICVCGYKKNIFFECAKKPVAAFFKTMNIEFSDELFFAGVNEPGQITKIKHAKEKAYKLGRKLAHG